MKKPRSIPKCPKISAQAKDAIYALPLEAQFVRVYTDSESGFSVYRHLLVDEQKRDYYQVLAAAKAYAKEADCRINPEVHIMAAEGRRKIFPDIEDGKSPDLYVKKYGYVDVKSPEVALNSIRQANKASKQSAIVVIADLEIKEPVKPQFVRYITSLIFADRHYTRDQVLHWLIRGELYKYIKPRKE